MKQEINCNKEMRRDQNFQIASKYQSQSAGSLNVCHPFKPFSHVLNDH